MPQRPASPMPGRVLEGKVALVTGGGSGIGRATALAFARAGARVAIGNRSAEQGASVVAEIERAGGEALFQPTDVRDPDAVQALVEQACAVFGRLDLAFNNAGAGFSPRCTRRRTKPRRTSSPSTCSASSTP